MFVSGDHQAPSLHCMAEAARDSSSTPLAEKMAKKVSPNFSVFLMIVTDVVPCVPCLVCDTNKDQAVNKLNTDWRMRVGAVTIKFVIPSRDPCPQTPALSF